MQLMTRNHPGLAGRTQRFTYDHLFGCQRKVEFRLEGTYTLTVRIEGVAPDYRRRDLLLLEAYEIESQDPYRTRSLMAFARRPRP